MLIRGFLMAGHCSLRAFFFILISFVNSFLFFSLCSLVSISFFRTLLNFSVDFKKNSAYALNNYSKSSGCTDSSLVLKRLLLFSLKELKGLSRNFFPLDTIYSEITTSFFSHNFNGSSAQKLNL